MADGQLKINTEEAKAKANQMVKIADSLEQLLAEVTRKMNEINDEEVGMYQGNKRPSELRAELDQFGSMFHKAHEQIVKSSNDIIAIATKAEAE